MKKDSIVESIKKQFDVRSKKGQAKYGTTLDENNDDDFLQHLKEELMDAVLYIEKLQVYECEDCSENTDKLIVGKIYWFGSLDSNYGILHSVDYIEDTVLFYPIMVDSSYLLDDNGFVPFSAKYAKTFILKQD